MSKKRIEEIIDKEKEIWQEAYPLNYQLLENFADKIKSEIKLRL